MVKPYLSIRLKDPQHYYLEDETLHCVLTFKSEKILKEPIVRVKFIGQASSYAGGAKQHTQNIFTAEKDVSVSTHNNAACIKKMNEIEFSVGVPNGVVIPSHRALEGSDGGKIEYMIEANLETAGFLKRSIQASHIIQVSLVGKVNINEDGLERSRDSSIRWPKNEENANTCVLSAWVPHEGCMRGKPVTVRVEYKQPERYEAVKAVTVSLIRQEIIASSKDSLPDMTKQLADKVAQKAEKAVELVHEGPSRLLAFSSVVLLDIPSNVTPTINQNAKVMRIDYKVRVTVKIPGVEHDGKDKELSVNLPIVVGTTGVSSIYDSGFEASVKSNPLGQYQSFNRGSEGSQSVHDGGDGSMGFRGVPSASHPPFFSNNTPYPPIAHGLPGGAFFMPEPFQPYPPLTDEPRFVLNPQKMAYTSDDSIKIEGMPMPTFEHSDQLINEIESAIHSPTSDAQPFMYPPAPVSNRQNRFRASVHNQSMYPPNNNNNNQDTVISTTTSEFIPPLSPLYGLDHPKNNNSSTMDGLASSLSRMSTTTTNTTTTSSGIESPAVLSGNSNLIQVNNAFVLTEKPNTPTPSQSRSATLEITENITKPRENASSYHSGVSVFGGSGPDSLSSPLAVNTNSQIATRIDPLLKLAQNDDL